MYQRRAKRKMESRAEMEICASLETQRGAGRRPIVGTTASALETAETDRYPEVDSEDELRIMQWIVECCDIDAVLCLYWLEACGEEGEQREQELPKLHGGDP
jgi:hypothetical protein